MVDRSTSILILVVELEHEPRCPISLCLPIDDASISIFVVLLSSNLALSYFINIEQVQRLLSAQMRFLSYNDSQRIELLAAIINFC